MTTGTVKFFDTTKGFGFITPEYNPKGRVRACLCVGAGWPARGGQRATFDVKNDARGPKAVNLQAD